MLQLDGYTFQPQPIERSEICSIHNVSRQGKAYKAVIYKADQIAKYSLQQTLEYNRAALKVLANTGTFLELREYFEYEKGEVHYFENYDMDLKTFIENNSQKQQKVLEILKDAMRSIGDAYIMGFYPINLRPQHLVMAENKWKIRSLVYQQSAHGNIMSCLVWDQSRQAPQAYSKKLEDEQLYNSLVWDLGSLVVHMLKGTHTLHTLQKIKQFCDKDLLKLRLSLNPSLGNLLIKMLAFLPQKRLKLQQLFNQKSFVGGFTQSQKSVQILDRTSRISLRQKSMIIGKNTSSQKLANENLKFSTIIEKQQPPNQLLMSNKIMNLQMNSVLQQSSSLLRHLALYVSTRKIRQSEKIPYFQLLPYEVQQRIYRKYKDQLGKTDLCMFLVDMASGIAFKQKKAQWTQLTKFILLVQCVMRIHRHANALNMGQNCYKFENDMFGRFMCTDTYTDLQTIFNRMAWQSENRLQKSRQLIKKANLPSLNLKCYEELQAIICSTVEQISNGGFKLIKNSTKQILYQGYQSNLNQYKRNGNQEVIQHTFLIMMIISINKMYEDLELDDRKAWKLFDDWRGKLGKDGAFQMEEVIEYVKKSEPERLVEHINQIGNKYYKKS